MTRKDFTTEAEALFDRFARKHELAYKVEPDVPMEVCWTFQRQAKLSMPVTLGLQNNDELNFGVSDFWSYFFPFPDVAKQFEEILNAWVTGEARIAVEQGRGRKLQLREGGKWTTVYGANGCLLPIKRKVLRYETNELQDG